MQIEVFYNSGKFVTYFPTRDSCKKWTYRTNSMRDVVRKIKSIHKVKESRNEKKTGWNILCKYDGRYIRYIYKTEFTILEWL